MTSPLIFYYNPMSRGRIVHWMLEEVGAAYEIKLLDWQKNAHKSPEYLKINPMGKIPAIVHKETVVTETAAICMYLADEFSTKGLAPSLHDPRRGTYLRWFFFAASNMEPAFLDKKNPRTHKVPSSQLGYGSYEDVVRTLESLLANGYALGDSFSALDVYLASAVDWALLQKDLDPTPVFENYVKRCTDRPAFRRFTEKAGPIG